MAIRSTHTSNLHRLREGDVDMRYPIEPVTIEYDSRGTRARKAFIDYYKARQFYALKDKQGKRPKVVRVINSQPGGS